MGQFERIKYPDGQISAKRVGTFGSGEDTFLIKERINSYEDLFYVRAIADVLNSGALASKSSDYRLFIPCMFGQRSDRRFSALQSFDLKLIADVINECGFAQVQILDPHSDVSMALVNKSVKVTSFEYVHRAIKHYHDWNAACHNGSMDPVLISPDAGAYKKVFDYAEKLNLELIGANKHRGPGGTIDLTFTGDVKGKPCFIIDDLCDGGRTFIILADALKKAGAREVYLYVTHGIFSNGFTELKNYIDRIYCTNSVKDLAGIQSVTLSNDGKTPPIVDDITNYVVQFNVI